MGISPFIGAAATTTQYIEVAASGGRYAVEMARVRQLLRWEVAVEIPRSSRAVRGAVNVRGQIVPVIDLRRAMGLEDIDYGRRGVVVLLQEGSRSPNRFRSMRRSQARSGRANGSKQFFRPS